MKIKVSHRRTKIIATVGPALLAKDHLEQAVESADAIRFNFSHLDLKNAESTLKRIEKCTNQENNVALIADLKGPEIRSDARSHILPVRKKVTLVCTTPAQKNKLAAKTQDQAIIHIDHPRLDRLVKKNQRITADDGNIEFAVLKTAPGKIFVQTRIGGTLPPNKTVNVPGVDLELPILDNRDKASLRYICSRRFNWIALSFVSSAADIVAVKKFIQKYPHQPKIIAKIENDKSIENITEITKMADGIMVARGDLGENLPYAKIPILQEKILNVAQKHGKLIIIATQMLESLLLHPRPSRPEVTDVAMAVRSRVDAVMLSGETASGPYPLTAIKVMSTIIEEAENSWTTPELYPFASDEIIFPIIKSGLQVAHETSSKYLIAITTRGKSPRLLAALRSPITSIVASSNQEIFQCAHLYYGISPMFLKISRLENKEERLKSILNSLPLKKKEGVILLFGFPFKANPTNTIRWRLKG